MNGVETSVSLKRHINGTKVTLLRWNRTPSPLDKTVYALFEKHRMVELLHSFVIFDGKVKKIARYQQYFAIESIMERIAKLDNTGRRQGGLIWHTQGSGKSLTMVMLAKVIKRSISRF